ncbi:MAG TPA: DoxX family protein [Symbiobacteriaceae bacterium]|jgi:thiosulfate dehydrogenase [quinone] large subunit|nr:DoxX family protein [Symbiobacteriaceae bacterium]
MSNRHVIANPPLARYLFDSPNSAWIWLIARVYLGWQWLQAGLHKVTDPAWMNGGTALRGFWERAVAMPAAPAKPAITYGWYRSFLMMLLEGGHYTWFGKLIAIGEVAIGTALILGLFTGIFAFAGSFMNFNFMLAGTTSTNPVLFAIATFLVLAWKVAGYWGVDRFLLGAVGTPWERRGGEPEAPTGTENRPNG